MSFMPKSTDLLVVRKLEVWSSTKLTLFERQLSTSTKKLSSLKSEMMTGCPLTETHSILHMCPNKANLEDSNTTI